MTGSARFAALKALLRTEKGGYSNIVLNSVLKEYNLDARDKALASTLFYGVLERRITLDYIIGFFSKTPVGRITPSVLYILRMGVYQIIYLEKIPDSAAVNESVRLTKEFGQARASGFVNAVLRNLLRGRDKVKFPAEDEDFEKYLSVEYSLPKWLVTLWEKSYGRRTAGLLAESMAQKPDIYIRVNNTVISEEKLLEELKISGFECGPVKWPDNAVRVSGGNLAAAEAYKKGFFHVQDLSSQICCRLFSPEGGETVADVCAAPGGKTFTAAERMGNRGTVLSFDKYKARVKLITEGARRLGLSIVNASERDALSGKISGAFADRVLCDAPCSGLGVLRRKPEIKYKNKSELDSLPDLQYRILCRSSKLVKKGGILFYSTCTLNSMENSGVAERFLLENKGFEPLGLCLPENLVHAVDEPANQLTLMPYLHGTDGFFIASFIKTRE